MIVSLSSNINWLIPETQKVPTIMQSPESKYEKSLWKEGDDD